MEPPDVGSLELKGLSESVEIVRGPPDIGRHAVAARDIEIGETMIAERPVASALFM